MVVKNSDGGTCYPFEEKRLSWPDASKRLAIKEKASTCFFVEAVRIGKSLMPTDYEPFCEIEL